MPPRFWLLVESKHSGMNCEAYPSRLALVLAVIDNGGISLADSYYGSDGHKAALDAVEQKIKAARAFGASARIRG